MIIVDYSNTVISNLMVELGWGNKDTPDENTLRHMILNSLRRYNKKFKNEYGEMVIACDGGNVWRKDIFAYYKANRAKSKDEDNLDWGAIFEILNRIRDEIAENLPYKVISLDKVEGDDIIAVLSRLKSTVEKVVIISSDSDFIQLHGKNIEQYDAVRDRWIETPAIGSKVWLKQKIMKGDGKDGVPNFLSPENSLVLKIRQKSVFQKKMDVWVDQEPEDFCDDVQLKRYRLNEQLLDLSKIPDDIQDLIINKYISENNFFDRSKLMNYFMEKRLKLLMEDIGEF